MPTAIPKLRSDLLFRRQGQDGEATFVVKDPVNRQFFRLKEEEHFMVAQMDGQTSLETIRHRVEEKFNATLTLKSLSQFTTSLRKLKLLDSGPADSARPVQPRRLRGSFLYLRLHLFDPDAWLGRLAKPARFCFTPWFVAGTTATILWALTLAVTNWDVLRLDLTQILRWDALILLCVAACVVTTAHEFAHGLTCKQFGGEVREMGFLLLYFQPAFYCNVSDAWLFPEKRQRLWVGVAGPYFELFLWACAVFIWRLTDSDTGINHVALAVLATSGIKTLLNFNPLLKLDGYYLLSDWLDMPNLRRRAYQFVGAAIKRLVRSAEESMPEIPPRDRRVYVIYGLVSAVFSTATLGYMAVKLGGYLIDNRQPETLLVATAFFGFKVRRRFRRWFGKSSDASDLGESPATEIPPESNGADEDTKPARDHKPTPTGRVGFAALLIGIVLAMVFFGRMQLRISGPFAVLPAQNADVRVEIGSTIEKVCIGEGDRVRAGDVIAVLSDRDSRTALLKTESDIDQMRAQLRLLQAGPRPEEIELARIGVARAEGRARFANKNLNRDKQLALEHLISQRDFDASEQAVADSGSDVAEATKRLEVLLAGSRPEEIDATKAGISRLETQHRLLEWQLAQVKVTSPADGIVVTPGTELKEMVGQLVKEGDLIAKVHELKTVEIQTPVSERDIADIKVGYAVALKARAYPGQTFHGAVSSIGTAVQGAAITQNGASPGAGSVSTASTTGSSLVSARTVLVTTRITNDDLLLKPGMTGMVKISCGDRCIFELLTRRLARTVRVEFWSWW